MADADAGGARAAPSRLALPVISYVTVGADDLRAARRFYDAVLQPLGFGVTEGPEGLSYALPHAADTRPEFYVKPTFDGKPASAGNGAMVAFEAASQATVRAIHGAGLAAGGSDDGAPGFRAAYGPRFFVGYLRDPQGNKVAVFSSNPDDPARDD